MFIESVALSKALPIPKPVFMAGFVFVEYDNFMALSSPPSPSEAECLLMAPIFPVTSLHA
jgi:hypothetical protein